MADSSEKDNSKSTEVDEELAELLESAVKDFTEKPEKKEVEKKSDEVAKPTPPDTLWTDEFMRSTAARFEQNMASLFSPGSDGQFSLEQLGENIQRLAEATTQPGGFESSPDNEFSSIIAQTLRNLGENTDNLTNQFSEDQMMEMLGSFERMADGNTEPGELMPFMQKMMQNLLSRDILYPALSFIIEKYPAWLEENKPRISNEDFERCSKQYSLMKLVCTELENEKPDDSESVKRTRFDKVLELMREMQDCGSPPAELVNDLGPMMDEQGLPRIPSGFSPDQCVLQ